MTPATECWLRIWASLEDQQNLVAEYGRNVERLRRRGADRMGGPTGDEYRAMVIRHVFLRGRIRQHILDFLGVDA